MLSLFEDSRTKDIDLPLKPDRVHDRKIEATVISDLERSTV